MKFDDLTKHLGEFGPYQKRLYFLVCLPGISYGIQMLSAVFILATPHHRCRIPDLPNDTYSVQGEYHQCLINQTIPQSDGAGDLMYESCEIFVTGNGSDCSPNRTYDRPERRKCNEWVYDKSDFQSTFMQAHNLVCDKRTYRLHANMILFAGLTAGAMVTGLVGDIFGRRKALMMTVVLHVGGTIGQAFAPNYVTFVILKFITGFASVGLFLVIYVIGMELVGPSRRMFAGIVISFFWCTGLFVLLFFAYFIRYWDYLQMALSFPTVVLFAYLWIVPESTRWLIAKGRVEEAKILLDKAAQVNKTTIPEGLIEQIAKDERQESVWTTFKSPVMIVRTIIVYLNWALVSVIYFGLGLNVGSLHGDRYMNFLIANIVEAAAYAFLLLSLHFIGRRSVYSGTLIVGGVACLCTVFSVLFADKSLYWITTSLAMIGKFGAAAAFNLNYTRTAELYPTPMRNSAVGFGSMCARIGAAVSPYIADLENLVDIGKFSDALPFVVYGIAALVAGLLSMHLPETMHEKMPETLEDAINLGKKSSEMTYNLVRTPEAENEHNTVDIHKDIDCQFENTKF